MGEITTEPQAPRPTGCWHLSADRTRWEFIPDPPKTETKVYAEVTCFGKPHHWHVELREHEIKTSGSGLVQAACCHCGSTCWVRMSDCVTCGFAAHGVAAQYQDPVGVITPKRLG